jgi:hypothetical protein
MVVQQDFYHAMMIKAGRCYHGKTSEKMEEEGTHALEVGSEADAA